MPTKQEENLKSQPMAPDEEKDSPFQTTVPAEDYLKAAEQVLKLETRWAAFNERLWEDIMGFLGTAYKDARARDAAGVQQKALTALNLACVAALIDQINATTK
ncbi:MAG: hypothetical protein ABSG46_20130 [Candidatus Binataceae bacterium]|jgi:hypothetical protein